MMKQILLITDGCSNVGISPVTAAAHAHAEGMVVNVIGVIEQGDLNKKAGIEIEEMARAGGGMSRIVSARQLTQTVQLVTRKTVAHTIQQVVNEELKHILGESTLEDLPPQQRSRVVQVMDELEETSSLQIALLIDVSASMKPKLNAVKEAISDLMLSLQARQGKSEICVFHFPGREHQIACMDLDWTDQAVSLTNVLNQIKMGGTTPTGPALIEVVEFMTQSRKFVMRQDRVSGQTSSSWISSAKEASNPPSVHHSKDGMFVDYII